MGEKQVIYLIDNISFSEFININKYKIFGDYFGSMEATRLLQKNTG